MPLSGLGPSEGMPERQAEPSRAGFQVFTPSPAVLNRAKTGAADPEGCSAAGLQFRRFSSPSASAPARCQRAPLRPPPAVAAPTGLASLKSCEPAILKPPVRDRGVLLSSPVKQEGALTNPA